MSFTGNRYNGTFAGILGGVGGSYYSNSTDPFNLGPQQQMQAMPQLYHIYSPLTGENGQSTVPPQSHPPIIKSPFTVHDMVVLDFKKLLYDAERGKFHSDMIVKRLEQFSKSKLTYHGGETIDPMYNLLIANCGGIYLPIDYLIECPKNVNEAIHMMKSFLKDKGVKV